MDTIPLAGKIPDVIKEDQPDTYVRTFDSDKEAAMRTGTPPPAPPITTPPPAPKPSSPPPAPKPPAPPPAPAPKPQPEPAPAAAPVVLPKPEPVAPQRPVPPPEPVRVAPAVEPVPERAAPLVAPTRPVAPLESTRPAVTPMKPVDSLETYSSDFIEKVKKTRASKVTVLAAEQDAKTGEPEKEVAPKVLPLTLVYGVSGAFLLIAGGIGAYLAYAHYTLAHRPVVVDQQMRTPIAYDERRDITGRGTPLMDAFAAALEKPLDSGSVRLVTLASTTASSTETVLGALNTSAPGILVRNIVARDTMAGVLQLQDSQSAFFIVGVTSYPETFSGMLTWEPGMARDLGTLFPRVAATASTSDEASPRSTPYIFVDESVANHDVRIARDVRGQSLLIYGYVNPTTLVITRSPAAFTTLVERLTTSQTHAP